LIFCSFSLTIILEVGIVNVWRFISWFIYMYIDE